MKKIEAVISTYRFETLRADLLELGISDMTASEVMVYRKGDEKVYRGTGYRFDFVAEIQVVIVAADEHADLVVDKIIENGKTDSAGDVKIFVSPIENTYRIQAGKRREWKNPSMHRRW
jgi:nitrogen regulatory protein P-II 1